MGLLDRVLGFFGADEQTDAALSEKPTTNLMDLPNDQFQAALSELQLDPTRRDELVRQKRTQDSSLAPVYDAVAGADEALAADGRVRANILPMSRPEGMSAFDAFTSGNADLAFPGMVTGGAASIAKAIDAPAAAASGLIPMQDMADEALNTTSVVGLSAASLGRKPAGSSGTFLIEGPWLKDRSDLTKAEKMAAAGDDKLSIKKATGWENLMGEWVYEVSDKGAEIGLTAAAKGLTRDTKTMMPGQPLSQNGRIALKAKARQNVLELQKRYRAGEITEADMMDQTKLLEQDLITNLGSMTETREVVTQQPIVMPKSGRLDQVLMHDELYKYDLGIKDLSAEAGKQKATSAGLKGNYLGAYYPTGSTPPAGASRINSFKNAGSPEDIKSTLIHEVQHGIDDKLGSPNDGSNTNKAKVAQANAAQRVKAWEAQLKTDPAHTALVDTIKNLGITVNNYSIKEIDRALKEKAEVDAVVSLQNSFMVGEKTAKDLLTRFKAVPGIKDYFDAHDRIRNSVEFKISNMTDFDAYQRERGEAKSRLAQTRRNKSQDEIRNSVASDQLDVPENETYTQRDMIDTITAFPSAAEMQTDAMLSNEAKKVR
jgi:hypothetical protein